MVAVLIRTNADGFFLNADGEWSGLTTWLVSHYTQALKTIDVLQSRLSDPKTSRVDGLVITKKTGSGPKEIT